MKRNLLLGNALLVLATAGVAWGLELPANGGAVERAGSDAGRRSSLTGGYLASFGQPLGTCWCRDDYRPKPCPVFCLPPICGCRDSYCPKPAPCVSMPQMRGCCDDYCPKPQPCVSRPCRWPDFYKCPPSPPRCGPTPR